MSNFSSDVTASLTNLLPLQFDVAESTWIQPTALSLGLCLIWNRIISRTGNAMITTTILLRSASNPLMLTRNLLFKSETEQWLTVPICAFSALRIRAAVLIKRFDTQKSQSSNIVNLFEWFYFSVTVLYFCMKKVCV